MNEDMANCKGFRGDHILEIARFVLEAFSGLLDFLSHLDQHDVPEILIVFIGSAIVVCCSKCTAHGM